MPSFLDEFISGNVGGLLGITFVYPLDTAKTRLQTYNSANYKSGFDVFYQMSQTGGFRSLYRGLLSPACGFGLTFAISFSSYGSTCRYLLNRKSREKKHLSYLELGFAGAIAGFVQSPVRQVVERVKSVMQVKEINGGKTAAYKNSISCGIELVRHHGVQKGLFQGMSSVFLREVPQFAVYYPSYEFCKKEFLPRYLSDPFLIQLLSGGIAGIIQWLPPIFFVDVVKSRMQTASPGTYLSLTHCIQTTYKEGQREGPGHWGGVRIFMRGFVPALMRAFPLHAIIFLGYETTLSYLNPASTSAPPLTLTLPHTSRQ